VPQEAEAEQPIDADSFWQVVGVDAEIGELEAERTEASYT
jgi:hypothetical protein